MANEIVFERPSKENGRLYICKRCPFYESDYCTSSDFSSSIQQMTFHMRRHQAMEYDVPEDIFTQLAADEHSLLSAEIEHDHPAP